MEKYRLPAADRGHVVQIADDNLHRRADSELVTCSDEDGQIGTAHTGDLRGFLRVAGPQSWRRSMIDLTV